MKKKIMILAAGLVLVAGLGWLAIAQPYPGEGGIYGDDWLYPPEGEYGMTPSAGSTLSPRYGGACPYCGMGPGYGMGMGPGYGMGRGMGPGMMAPEGCPYGYPPGPGRQFHRQMYMDQVRRTDPARYKNILKIRELTQQYHATDDPARKKEIEKQLRPLVDREMKAEQQDLKKRIEWEQKRIEWHKKIMKDREARWDEAVDNRVKGLTGQNLWMNYPMQPW